MIEAEHEKEPGKPSRQPFAIGRAPDPKGRKAAPEARLRRRVDEPAVLQRLDALGDDAVRHVHALALVQRAQALDQLLFPHLLVELTLDQPLTMPERVNHIHREHQVIERGRSRGRLIRRGHWFGRRHQSGSALPSATSFAIRRLPSSTASRISAEFWVESLRMSSMICWQRSW